MIVADKEQGITYLKSTSETSSTGRMRKLSNYYEGEKGPYYGSSSSTETPSVPVGYSEIFSDTETFLKLFPSRAITKSELSQKERIRLKRLEASKRIDARRNKIGLINITAEELVQEGRRLRQEEIFGKGDE